MNISYLFGSHTGILGFLTIKALGHNIVSSVCYDDDCRKTADLFCVPHYPLKNLVVQDADIILSVHAREMIPNSLIKLTAKGIGFNIHPYLYAYKGADPIGRAIKDNNWKASVGVHFLTDTLDGGETIFEIFKKINPVETRAEVYSQIYLLYCEAIERLIRRIKC